MMSDGGHLGRQESDGGDGNDDDHTKPENAAAEEAKDADEVCSVAHDLASSRPEQNDHDDNRIHLTIETGEMKMSNLSSRSSIASPVSGPGLHINERFEPSQFDDCDVITVHGIRDEPKTAWQTTTKYWWIHDDIFTVRQIDFSYDTHEEADIFKLDGIATEARNLLTDYVAMRDDLPVTRTNRPVIWICHDIGGHIVKQALVYAAMQPQAYRQIALLTTTIVFLGVPHRAHSMEELEDQLHGLLVLPGPDDIKQGIVQKVTSLAKQVASINTQFLESNLNSRAGIVNGFGLSVVPSLQSKIILPNGTSENGATASKDGQKETSNNGQNDRRGSGKEENNVPGASSLLDQRAEDGEAGTQLTDEAKPEESKAKTDTNAKGKDSSESGETFASNEEAPTSPPVITPFPRYNVSMGYPFETSSRYRSTVNHLDLVKEGVPDDVEDREHPYWGGMIAELFNTAGFPLQLNYGLIQGQGNVLSLIPPRRTTSVHFDPNVPKLPFIAWIHEQEAYKTFRKRTVGPAMLYLHGIRDSDSLPSISKVCQKFYIDYDDEMDREYNAFERSVVYFEFDKRDCRYNNLSAMLVTFLSDIIWHFWKTLEVDMGEIFEMLAQYHSWSLEDLYFAFSYLRDHVTVGKLTFFISCFDQCGDTEREWFLERVLKAQGLSESTYKIIISTTGPDKFLTKALPASSIIELGNCAVLREDRQLAREIEIDGLESNLENLPQQRPIYRNFKSQLKELIDQCKEAPDLGHAMLTWLRSYKRGAPKAGLEAVIKKLSPITPQNLINVILGALSPERQAWARTAYRWVKHAVEPLTPEMLAQTLALSHSQDNEVSITDVDCDSLQHDLNQAFGGLIVVDGRDIKFCHDSFYDLADLELDGSSRDHTAEIHTQIAETCLRCLRLKDGQEILAATLSVERYGGPGATMLPRSSLAEYAARFWATHYTLAGANATREPAMAFFRDREALHTWAEAHYVASNAFTRIHRSYLSPLPYMAMLGLEDLVLNHIEVDKTGSSYDKDQQNQSYWHAIAEAARNGHRNLVLRLLNIAEIDEAGLRDAIFWAAAYGKCGALDDLVAKARGLDGFTWPERILGRAASAGLETLISALAESEYDLNKEMVSDGANALGIAAHWDQEGAVRLLLESKVDLSHKDKQGNTPLLVASKRGDPAILKLMLNAGADAAVKNEKGASSVHCAVFLGRPAALELLIEAGADFNSGNTTDPDASSYTRIPIVHAADGGYEECVRVLLKHNADAKAGSPQETALYCAAREGHVEICRMLLEKGADPNQIYTDKDMLLMQAIATKKKDLVELLVDNPFNNTAKIDASNPGESFCGTPLACSIQNGASDIFQLLLDKNADVNYVSEGSDPPLLVAAHFGEVEMAKALLARGANVHWNSSDGWTPLHAAAPTPEILRLLLDKGADIDRSSDNGTVVMIVARWGYSESLKILLAITPKPDLEIAITKDEHVDHKCTALLLACKYGNAKCVKMLLEAGAKVNHKTDDGSFALKYCLERGGREGEDTLKELLNIKPNLNETNSNGDTVLHRINARTLLSVVQLLAQNGAPTDTANRDGYTPLAVAVESGNKAVAVYLVQERHVRVKVYGPRFGSILHLAAGLGDLEMVKLLIEAKADHNAVDHAYGESVLYTALGNKDIGERRKILRYLVETAGVDVNAQGGRMGYPIIRAACDPAGRMLKYLIQHQADLNVMDDLGRRPIHVAAATSQDSVLALARAGAQLHVRDNYGRSPVHFCASMGSRSISGNAVGSNADAEMLNVLLKPLPENFQVDHVDDDGWTPLMWACRSEWWAWDRNLLDRLIDEAKEGLWARSKDNQWSPLKLACYHGWRDEEKVRLVPSEEKRMRKDAEGREQSWDDGFHKSLLAEPRFCLCSSCFAATSGIQWKCIECTEGFNLCFKCFPNRSTMHTPEHHFEKIGTEFLASSGADDSASRAGEGHSEEEEEEHSEEEEQAELDDEEEE